MGLFIKLNLKVPWPFKVNIQVLLIEILICDYAYNMQNGDRSRIGSLRNYTERPKIVDLQVEKYINSK